ncbi:sulfatase family protein [Ulvibacterium marinum]|uniref:Iduronate sulfatase n=1 Tax=Ulvibacterium marinum TaxID=2419782 RepID=A0A3B0C2E2_9FLAO|nr:sulfatase-like hydrolase/transferase [Ulvibacterium marinum]RKN78654.1 iduronate sulfatase [Ulvibacterium marinum]
MKIKITAFFILMSIVSISFGQEKPNVIVIFTDDQGYADIGANGQVDDLKTPNIDMLAKTGILVTSGYVTAPQCIPSRAGLLTGRYQQRFGLDHNGIIPLPLSETLIAERMQEAGYVTGMTGKWHLDPNHQSKEWIIQNLPELKDKKKYSPDDIPFEKKIPYMSSNRGFEKTFQGYGNNFWATYTLNGKEIQAQWIKQEGYRLDVQTDAAIEFIEKNSEKPFFFYLSYFAPHVPLEATKKYLDRFPEEMPIRRKYCLAMLSAIDDGIGKIKQTLRKMGVEENTIIFFISDNGAPLKITMEDKPISFKGGAWDGSLNTPWVGEKGMLSEGGIRVPFIVNWPAGLPKGKVYDRPVISLDVAATCLSLAGIDLPKKLDGVNLIPYLTGVKKDAPHDALYWRFWDQSAIRMGNLKFLKVGNREFLFDVTTAEHETKNLIVDYPDKAMQMKKKLLDWASELHVKGISETEIRREKKWYDHYFQNK